MEIDTLQLDLCMESVYIRELLAVKWLCESGVVENIEHVVEEYRQSRQLLVCMEGKLCKITWERGELWKIFNVVLDKRQIYEAILSDVAFMWVLFIFLAHSCVCTWSSCSGKKHSVQRHLSTLQTPSHQFERDCLWNHLTTGEIPTKHTFEALLQAFYTRKWCLIICRKTWWTILMQMQKIRTL